ncbi:MAG: hemolysin III family protein [Pseudomonadota bacterium]
MRLTKGFEVVYKGAQLGAKATAESVARLADPSAPAYRSGLAPALQSVAPPPPGALYSPAERIADGVIHVLGVVSSLVAISVLITLAAIWTDFWTTASIAIYGVGACLLFSISAAYHLFDWPRWRWLLRRLDHAAIFVKIAATYTPFATVSLAGGWGEALLLMVWSIAAVGVPLKLFAPQRLERAAVALYLVQGWLVVLAFGPLAAALSPTALALLVSGGLLYTFGVVFFLWERLPFHNAIWHGCVLAASAMMYGAVLTGVAMM